MNVSFKALEYTRDDRFIESEYSYSGSTESGWCIARNGVTYLALAPGYRLLRTICCGVCSTDLDRRFLPFTLPQIIGHEAVAADPDTGERFVIEINDTCIARGDPEPCPFCRSGLSTHCPERKVLGIDRLPGGFGPWLLAPVNALIPINGLSVRTAVLAEPFAAALHAVALTPPASGDRAAVVGTGRLGLLIIAALQSYRKSLKAGFSILALARSGRNLDRALALGADEVINLSATDINRLRGSSTVVFDASGSPEGLDTALALTPRVVHLKSTNGQEYHGLKHLTELVVDELSLLPYSAENLDFHWPDEPRHTEWLFMAPDVRLEPIRGQSKEYRGGFSTARTLLHGNNFTGRLPRFDVSAAASLSDIDRCIRPETGDELSLVRPRGAILFKGEAGDHPLLRFLNAGNDLRTSRCGNLRKAVQIMHNDALLAELLAKHLITHEFPANRLPDAVKAARSPEAVKVIVRH